MTPHIIPNAGGWACTFCGGWMIPGAWHMCSIGSPSLPDQTDRLISAIERLIAAIDNKGERR